MITLLLKPNNREVILDGMPLDPGWSQGLVNHSPDGFGWGYGGSGPAQLALAILLEKTPQSYALGAYQQFKWDIISRISPNIGSEVEIDLDRWMSLFAVNDKWNENDRVHCAVTKKTFLDMTPRQEVSAPQCGKGWSDRCARSKGKSCRCRCGGANHGKSRPV